MLEYMEALETARFSISLARNKYSDLRHSMSLLQSSMAGVKHTRPDVYETMQRQRASLLGDMNRARANLIHSIRNAESLLSREHRGFGKRKLSPKYKPQPNYFMAAVFHGLDIH